MKEILNGQLTLSHASQSSYFDEMKQRLLPLSHLEHFLDSNEIIFRYNVKVHVFSMIQADYLLQNNFEGIPIYLFLAQRSGENTQVCRTLFPKAGKDYAEGQPQYTLLKKEKRNMLTNETFVQYDRLTPKDTQTSDAKKRKTELGISLPAFCFFCQRCVFLFYSCSDTSSPKILSIFCLLSGTVSSLSVVSYIPHSIFLL